MAIGGVTCKPEGSGILLALVQLDVIVIELDRDDRLLRAEGGREDDLLSETHIKTHITQKHMLKIHPKLLYNQVAATQQNAQLTV